MVLASHFSTVLSFCTGRIPTQLLVRRSFDQIDSQHLLFDNDMTPQSPLGDGTAES
jgi:hypothetical protein